MVLTLPAGVSLADTGAVARIEAALTAVWRGVAENDGFNQLTLRAGLDWTLVAVLRALSRYLRQLGFAFSQRYLAATLAAHGDAATALVDLFHTLHTPEFSGDRVAAAEAARQRVTAALEQTRALDEDRIIRRVLNLVEASVRTNFYQRDALGARRPALGIKFDCHKVEGMPEPRPFREIFVYSPRVEGLHLRFGPVARGGLRWSDRPEDFRTEVLGLVKAQQVKNAIIVPVGAKGAFVPKTMPAGADREATQREGVACYRIFISTLLDVTDNIAGDGVVPPPSLRRRDGDDPYLVVAADKGTASFSDIANKLAIERGYWLGDAFASGGSVGYDHKKMGITARGAWESVKRHFRELGHDVQAEPFTVAGVGDMSGDVFGNGMLLSPRLRLVAAFDHRDIFIDPDPDPVMSFAERQRLFEQPRSSWQDYNRTILSRGGAIYSRDLKSIELEPEARAVLGFVTGARTPQEIIIAILRAKVDLLWFGGIGTYVRAPTESNADAGDRANDGVRIVGRDIRALVVGEGANLAMTQHGRVDYALKGGRLNTDAIDNSAGVNSSDLEVNIKIALGSLVAAGTMSYEQRNEFLASMTTEVAELCLRNNYLQTLALSLAERDGLAGLPEQRALLEHLEATGELDRAVEFLPDDATLDARLAVDRGFTRPELAALLAYAKSSLRARLVASGVPDDPYLARELFAYFPAMLAEAQREAIETHRLRREVIATVLANAMINRGGPGFVVAMMAATSADAATVTAAYALARDAFGLTELNRLADGLDGVVSASTQLGIYADIETLLKRQTLWFLRNETFETGLSELVPRYAQGVADLRQGLASLLPASLASPRRRRAARGFEAMPARRPIWRGSLPNCPRSGLPATLSSWRTAPAPMCSTRRRRSSRWSRPSGLFPYRRGRRGAPARRPLRSHGARPRARQPLPRRARSRRRRADSGRRTSGRTAHAMARQPPAGDRAGHQGGRRTHRGRPRANLRSPACRSRRGCCRIWRGGRSLLRPAACPRSVPEMPQTGEHHGDTGLVGGIDYRLIIHRAARLDHRGRPGCDRRQEAVREREKGIGGNHRILRQRLAQPRRLGGILGLPMRRAARIDAAHLPRADAHGGPVPDIDHGVRLDVLGHFLGDQQVGHLRVGRRFLGHHPHLDVVRRAVVARLHQQPAGQRADGQAAGLGVSQRAGQQQPEVFLAGDDADRLGRRGGRDDHLGEHADYFGRRRRIDLAVERHDAAKGTHRIGAEGEPVGGRKVIGEGEAARIGVLDDGDGSPVGRKLRHQLERRIGIVEVVVGEALALQLRGGGDTGPRVAGLVERRPLMRVLAVAHHLGKRPGKAAIGQVIIVERFGKPARDHRIIGRGTGIGLCRELLPHPVGHAAGANSLEHRGVVGGVDHHRDISVVLRRGADHRRAADVDVLDHRVVVGARGDGLLEWVEVGDQQIDLADAVRIEGGAVVSLVANREEAAMDFRVQCLDAAIHHLGEAGELGNVLHRGAGRGDQRPRTAGRDELDAEIGKPLGELGETSLVEYREQRPPHLDRLLRGHHRLLSCCGRWLARHAASGNAGEGCIGRMAEAC